MDYTFKIPQSKLQRFSPEPANSFLQGLGKTMRTAASYASSIAGFAGQNTTLDQFGELVRTQSEVQMQMMLVSMQSNLSRTEHETKMAAVRNMRVA